MRPRTYRCLLDHLVGLDEYGRRYRDPKRSGRLEVDDQFELGRLLDRQVSRLGPLEDATSVDAQLTIRVLEVGAVTHQATRFDKFAPFVDYGNRVFRRKSNEMVAAVVEERVGSDDHRICASMHIIRESRIEFIRTGGIQCLELQSDSARCFLQLLDLESGTGTARICENSDGGGFGHELTQKLKSLWAQLRRQYIHPSGVATWTI